MLFLNLNESEVKEIYKTATIPCKDADGKVAGAFIVYLDKSDRLRYLEDKYVANERDLEFRNCIGKITSLNAQPLNVDDQNSRRNFHEMLACAYAQASHGNLPSAYMFIIKAKEYYKSITTERARKCSLNTTGWIVIVTSLLAFVLVYIKHYCFGLAYYDWLIGMYMGILGASVSIWQRYGKIEFTGYAPKYLYKLEIGAREIYGIISSIVLMALIKDGWITSHHLNLERHNISILSIMLIGFFAGFFERFIPSIAEQFVTVSAPKSKKIYKPVEILETNNEKNNEENNDN